MNEITVKQILQALSHVDDPDLKKDIVTLGMVKDIKAEGRNVSFTVELTTPACPLKAEIEKACRNAIKHFISDAENIDINMSARVSSRRDKSEVLPGVKNIIAIASGKGGVGKSTVAANLAFGLSHLGAKVGLLDADIYGPSVPIIMGLKGSHTQINSNGKMIPLEKDGIKVLSIGFMIKENQPVVWRGPMISSAFKQLINDADWGDLDYLIIDLPPGTGDIHLTMVQHLKLTGIVMVTTPQDVAIADCRRAMSMYLSENINTSIIGIIENMSWFVPDDAPEKKYFIFGEGGATKLSDEFNIPIIGQIPMFQNLQTKADNGTNPYAESNSATQHLIKITEEFARLVSIKNSQISTTSQI
ncbi:MAG: Mrp/NBP35 family ATP-binding protein [Bacteroidia bacterium]|nr:Mrp/NBP35 family ATP-binding protein [Bacteroidia bacterium]